MNRPGPGRAELRAIARRAMMERGLLPDFPPAVMAEVGRMQEPAFPNAPSLRDLRALPWCSIDNDDSRDLDQLTVAMPIGGGRARVMVAVADVDHLVVRDSPVDAHAAHNTTSIYTAAQVFPMLPERLSTNLTSLAFGEDRLATVVEMALGSSGELESSEIHRAWVHNHAKLAYDSVSDWLDGTGPALPSIAGVPGLDANLRLQDELASRLRELRFESGALDLESIEPRPVFEDDAIRELRVEKRNRARELIEDFMIAANGVTARFLKASGLPSLRRVVREPARWERIVALADQLGEKLPQYPDSGALQKFLARRRTIDPERFPDLSLTVIKLLGAGEYVVERPGEEATGHFGLAVRDYAHSTAPNRRYPDLISQRLVKAALERRRSPYGDQELGALAEHCTEMEDAADKVERQVRKSAAALLIGDRIGDVFEGFVTGASEKGTWVRILNPPVEGKVVQGSRGLDVGDRVRVKLIDTSVERGFIDFARA